MCSIITLDAIQQESYIHSSGSAAQHGIARIVDPLRVGKSAWRINGQWTVGSYPDQDLLLQADLVLMGGHENPVEAIDLLTLDAAGITYTILGPCESGSVPPGPYHLYPSSFSYPSTTTYPE